MRLPWNSASETATREKLSLSGSMMRRPSTHRSHKQTFRVAVALRAASVECRAPDSVPRVTGRQKSESIATRCSTVSLDAYSSPTA